MYEELQQKKPPRVPKSIKAKGFRGLLGITSPSRTLSRSFAPDQTEEEKRYFGEMQKYRLYKRIVSREEWRRIYREYRKEQHPERAQEWEHKRETINGYVLRFDLKQCFSSNAEYEYFLRKRGK